MKTYIKLALVIYNLNFKNFSKKTIKKNAKKILIKIYIIKILINFLRLSRLLYIITIV